MTGTKRVPLTRQRQPPVTERAVRLFMKMQRHAWESDPWWALESELRGEVGAKPWDYPCIERGDNPFPPDHGNHGWWKPNEEARALWLALAAGARELRRQARAAKQAKVS